jgi:hypothetical protein
MATWSEPRSNYGIQDEVKPEIFNNLAENEKYLKETQDTKITSAQVQDATIASVVYGSRTNISASETLKVGFGKVRKWFADLKALAFKDAITEADISGTISGGKINGAVALATKATQLETSRSIGLSGVTATARSFNGTSAITIPITAVPASLLTGTITLDSTGNAATATKLKTARSFALSGVTAQAVNFDGSGNVTLVITGVPATLLTGTASIPTSGNAGSATKLQTARTIGLSGVTATAQSFNGTANITIPITAIPVSLLTGTLDRGRLPVATATAVGAVKGGSNVTVAADGTMTATFSGTGITVTARAGLGNLTNLDAVLNYISNVFLGSQAVTKIKAGTFDTTS